MNTDEETTSLWEPSTESTQLGLGWWARPRLGAAWTPQRLDHVKGEARLVCNHDINGAKKVRYPVQFAGHFTHVFVPRVCLKYSA